MEKTVVLCFNALFAPVRVVGLEKLEHPGPGEVAVLRGQAGEFPAIKQTVEAAEEGNASHKGFVDRMSAICTFWKIQE